MLIEALELVMGTDLLAFSMGFVVEHGAGKGDSILKNSPIAFAVQPHEAQKTFSVRNQQLTLDLDPS